MNDTKLDQYRLRDKSKLVRSVNYYTSLFALVFGIICYFFLDIKGIIPLCLFSYTVLNMANVLLFNKHGRLLLTYNISSLLAMIIGIVITLSSGGIRSPFIFVLGIVVFAGYVSTRIYGKSFLLINLLVISLIYLLDLSDFHPLEDTVPEASKNLFAYLSVLASLYLLGGVFGKNLLKAHHKLYKSRQEIASRIEEKETLLKEVHHRVKNNLQTVSSLLSLQSRSLDDKKISSIVKSSQNRVVSMAMVHEMLYKRDDYLSKIEVQPYVQELCEYLLRSIKGNSNKVELKLDIENLKLGIDTVIPLGLIVNETVTNALKYGIPEDTEGEILIQIKRIDAHNFELYLGDNGIGFPESVNPKKSKSLGLKLIHNLTRQLKGKIERDLSKKGTYYRITFEEIVQDFNTID